MTYLQHTPGPWQIGDDGPIHYTGTLRPTWNIYGPDRLVAGVEHFRGDAWPNANARLIAAAPRLLDTLERLRGDMLARALAIGDGFGDWIGLIDAAIAETKVA